MPILFPQRLEFQKSKNPTDHVIPSFHWKEKLKLDINYEWMAKTKSFKHIEFKGP